MTEHATVKVGRSPRDAGPVHPAGLLRFHPLGTPPAMRFHALGPAMTVIGRSESCTIHVEDDQVSRRHALVEALGSQWRIGDCDSANGLYVGGQRVEEHLLGGGELLRVGSTLLRFIAAGQGVDYRQTRLHDHGLVGGPALAPARSLLDRAAASDLTLLITGETGTGKEVAARYLHEHGPHRTGPFIAVNCAAIPVQLVESELFGHVKGAFTGATTASAGMIRRAHGGTLLLDEIGELPPESQAKLLRVLQERTVQPVGGADPVPVEVRVVSATNRDLDAAVGEGAFRADLFARIAEMRLHLPPLRERFEDIPLLVHHFLGKQGDRREVGADVLEALCLCRWPFNVRELESAVRRARVLAGDAPRLGTEHFEEPVDEVSGRAADPAGRATSPAAARQPPPEALELEEALREHEGDVDRAAAALGISRSQLYRRAQKHGIQVSAFRPLS